MAQQLLVEAEQQKDKEEIAYCKKSIAGSLSNISSVYRVLADYPKALSYVFSALKIKEELNDKPGMASTYNNLANIYIHLNEYDNGLQYYLKAYSINKETGNKDWLSNNVINIGYVYSDLGDIAKQNKNDSLAQCYYKTSFQYYFEGLELKKAQGDKHGEASAINNLGVSMEKRADSETRKGNNDSATHLMLIASVYFNKALSMREQMNDKLGIVSSHINLGSLYLRRGDNSLTRVSRNNFLKEAIRHFEISLRGAFEIDSKDEIRETYSGLAEACSKAGRDEDALKFYKNFIAYHDSITNTENTKKESAQKAGQEKKDALSAEELKQQKLVQRFMVYGLLIVMAAALFILRSFLQKKKANKLLEEKNILIEKQKQIVEMKQKEILDSIYYARRIQRAIITSEHLFEKYLRR